MIVLRIEHKVPNFEGWRKAFKNDPIDRKKSGVKRYRVYRPLSDPNFAIIELEFNNKEEAEKALSMLQKLWTKVEGTIMVGPKIQLVELIDELVV